MPKVRTGVSPTKPVFVAWAGIRQAILAALTRTGMPAREVQSTFCLLPRAAAEACRPYARRGL